MDELIRTINSNNEDERDEEEEGPLDSEGTLDIWEAAQKGSLKGVKFYLAQNPSNLNKKHVGKGRTPLHCASYVGRLEIAKYLLSKSAQVDPKTKRNQTPLLWACHRGHVSIANLLLDKGADINYLDIYRDTPLHFAVDGNHLDVVKLLIRRGADRTIKNNERQTPLQYAIELTGRTSIVKYLRSL